MTEYQINIRIDKIVINGIDDGKLNAEDLRAGISSQLQAILAQEAIPGEISEANISEVYAPPLKGGGDAARDIARSISHMLLARKSDRER